MVASEHTLLLEQRLLSAVFTSAVDALFEPGPNEDVAVMSELVQDVRLVSLSRVDKKVEHPWLIPAGMDLIPRSEKLLVANKKNSAHRRQRNRGEEGNDGKRLHCNFLHEAIRSGRVL